MATALRPVGYDDRLSVVEHLDELRTRLIICVVAFVVAFTVCLLATTSSCDVVNQPLKVTTEKRTEEGKGILGEIYVANQTLRVAAGLRRALVEAIAVAAARLKPAVRARPRRSSPARRASRAAQRAREGSQPVTLGLGRAVQRDLHGRLLLRAADQRCR